MRIGKKINKLLGEILVEKRIITKEQLNEALKVQAQDGGLIGEIIVKLGFASEEEIAQCLSYQYGFAYLPLDSYEISQEVIRLVPKNIVSHYCLIPLDRIGDTLTVVMANPLNLEAIEDIEDLTHLEVQAFISTPTDIRNAIKKYYGE